MEEALTPRPHLRRSFRVLHLDQNSVRDKNTAIDFLKNKEMAETNKVVEGAGIGDNDHAVFTGCSLPATGPA
jgi:hypothetical protein